MKKLTIAALAFTTAVSAAPLTTEAAYNTYMGSYNISNIQNGNYEDIMNMLDQYGINYKSYVFGGNNSYCPDDVQVPNQPETETPSTPETEQPETSTPENGSSEENEDSSFAKQVLNLVNKEREKAGLKALVLNENAQTAANVRAKEIVTSFSHTRPNGTSFSTALKESGASYRGAGENIAWGQQTPEKVMEAWMNSAGHRANILNEKFTSIGIGHYVNNNTNYWTQLFMY